MEQPLHRRGCLLLVGVWGAGKTSLARRVAQALNWSTQDADTLIPNFVESARARDSTALEERSRRLRAIITDPAMTHTVVATTMRPPGSGLCR